MKKMLAFYIHLQQTLHLLFCNHRPILAGAVYIWLFHHR